MTFKAKILFLFVSIGLISCGSSTSISSTWVNPEISDEAYKSVFIAAITPDIHARKVIEQQLATEASKQGIKAIQSSDVFLTTFTKDNQPQKQELLEEIRKSNSHTIFTISLKDKESSTRYVEGTNTYYPMNYGGYYGGFYSYYNNVYPVVYEPGYYKTDKIYYVESNLYDANTEELLWSAQSKTYNPTNLKSFAQEYTKAIIYKLIKDGVLKK